MFSPSDSQKNEAKIQAISIQMEALQRELDSLFGELGVSREEVQRVSGSERPAVKQEPSVVDPRETKKTLKEAAEIRNHWLFVR